MGLGSFFNNILTSIPIVGPVVKGVETVFGGDDGNDRLSGVGSVLGDAASGASANAFQGGQLALAQGQLSKSLYDAALQRAKIQASLPSLGASQAVQGDLLANMQDVTPSGSPQVMAHLVNFSGGIRPSALGPNARQAGANLSKAGLANQSLQLPTVPNMPDMPSSVLPNILGGGALTANLIAAIRKGLPQTAGGATPSGFLPYGPPAPDDPWNGDSSMYGGG